MLKSLCCVFPICIGLLACGTDSAQEYIPEGNDGFTIAILPDTQGYSQFYPEIWQAQTDWLADNADLLNVKIVIHVGDLVEGSWRADQWQVAQDKMGILTQAQLPFIIAPGNHDYGAIRDSRNARDRSTLLDQYFPLQSFEAMPTFGGVYPEGERVDNSYHTFEAGGSKWLVLALEFGPRDALLDWANDIVLEHADHKVIIATHAYLYPDGTRYDWATKGADQAHSPHTYGIAESPEGLNDGQEMWDKFVSRHSNIVAVVSGHVLDDGLGYQVSRGAGQVHEMVANYQSYDFAGDGYLRLLQFDDENKKAWVRSYSPFRDSAFRDEANQFRFTYEQ
ncbi:MAG: metallophosphoesterase [Kofleriaceae bacterium]|nr:metallophosphoesterase [Kofleriaceae bacterium]